MHTLNTSRSMQKTSEESGRPKLENAGNFFAVRRQFTYEVVVADVETAVASTGQCHRRHQSCLINTTTAASTVDVASGAVAKHRRHAPRTLFQVDVRAVAFVQDTCTWFKFPTSLSVSVSVYCTCRSTHNETISALCTASLQLLRTALVFLCNLFFVCP